MRWHNAYWSYLTLSAGTSLAFAIITTMNLVYQADTIGLNAFQLVLVGTVLETTCLVFEIPTGIVADLYSRRLSVIIGLTLEGAGFLLEGLVPTFAAVLISQIIWGIGATFCSGADEAWIADELGTDQLGHVYLRGTQVGQAAGIVGIIVSTLLAMIALNIPVVTGGAMLVVLAVFLAVTMPERGFRRNSEYAHSPRQARTQAVRQSIGAIRTNPVILIVVSAALAAGAASEGFDRLWRLHLERDFILPALGPLEPVAWFGVVALGAAPLSILAAEFVRRRCDLTDSTLIRRLVVALTGIRIVAIALFALTSSLPAALASLWLAMFVWSIYSPVSATWLNQHVDSRVRATVISVRGQADALGQIAAGPVIGAIGTLVSLRAAMLAVCVALSPLFALYGRLGKRRLAPNPPAEVAEIEQ